MLGIFVFMGSILFCVVICGVTTLGFGYLLDFAVRSRGELRRSSDNPPAAAEGVGTVLLLLGTSKNQSETKNENKKRE
ncbi:hypothetical protein, partial [Tumidithrix elongata]